MKNYSYLVLLSIFYCRQSDVRKVIEIWLFIIVKLIKLRNKTDISVTFYYFYVKLLTGDVYEKS